MDEIIKQDINFLEFPLWVPRERDQVKVFEMNDLEGYRHVSSSGVPSKVDMMILYFLMLHSQNKGHKRTIKLSMYEVLKGCGINPSRKERLRESLDKWMGVNISFSGTFYDNKKYLSLNFHVLDSWKIEEKTKNQVEVVFNEEWLAKIKSSNFFKYVSFAEMKHLRSPVAMRLYEILSKSFYSKDVFQISSDKLVTKLQLSQKYFSEIKRLIIPAVKIISEKTSLNLKLETRSTGKNEGVFIFTKVKKSMLDLMKSEMETGGKEANKVFDEATIMEVFTPEEIEVHKQYFIENILPTNKFLMKKYNLSGYTDIINMSFISYLKTRKSD